MDCSLCLDVALHASVVFFPLEFRRLPGRTALALEAGVSCSAPWRKSHACRSTLPRPQHPVCEYEKIQELRPAHSEFRV